VRGDEWKGGRRGVEEGKSERRAGCGEGGRRGRVSVEEGEEEEEKGRGKGKKKII
jgi:hypothetical protein